RSTFLDSIFPHCFPLPTGTQFARAASIMACVSGRLLPLVCSTRAHSFGAGQRVPRARACAARARGRSEGAFRFSLQSEPRLVSNQYDDIREQLSTAAA